MQSFDTPQSGSKVLRRANALKKEVALWLLTSRHCAPDAPYLARALSDGENAARTRMKNLNLAGIGFGVKETNGALTGDLAVRVYVTNKLPKKDLLRQYRVPDSVNGIVTDVIPVGELKLHGRPAAIGEAISHIRGEAGSIGCVVTVDGRDDWFLLSASHVLAPAGASTGDLIIEPPVSQRGTVPIAELSQFKQLQSGGVANSFDAGLARLLRKDDIDLTIPKIGRPRPDVMDAALYQSVRKYGAGTLTTLGVVTDVSAEATFSFSFEDYLFADVIQVTGCGTNFSAGADSGALVVDALTNRAVSLIIGGAGFRSFTSPIRRVLTSFRARIVV
jgi:hypothetical protein